MKPAAIILPVFIWLAGGLHPTWSSEEPKKNLTVSPPSVSMRLPENKVADPTAFRAFCGVRQPCDLREYSTQFGVCGLYVLKNGVVRLEMFNNSKNIRCKEEPNGIDKMFGVASVTKSITSSMLAKVLAEKYQLRTVAEFEKVLRRSVGSFLDASDNKKIATGYATIELDHMLQMRSGIGWREETTWPFTSDSRRFDDRVRQPPRKETLLDFAARYGLKRSEIRKFNYSALDAAMVSSVAASAVDGGNLLAAFQDGVWAMIGAKHSARWNVDIEGRPIGSCCFSAKIDDLARFGDFVLNKGKGKMPSAWFDLATARRPERFEGVGDESDGADESCKLGYGYFWWLRQGRDDFTAYGRDGQFIHIYPKERVVIVQLSDWGLTKVSNQARCISMKTHDEIVRQIR